MGRQEATTSLSTARVGATVVVEGKINAYRTKSVTGSCRHQNSYLSKLSTTKTIRTTTTTTATTTTKPLFIATATTKKP